MTNSYILHVDGSKTPFEPANGKNFTLDELREAVSGFIEMVYLPNNVIMVVNEEGKILNFRVNKEASMMYLKEINGWDFIVGDVVITTGDYIE